MENHFDDTHLRDIVVLYVEDEESIRERLARFLQRRIDSLHLAVNGQDGLEKFREINPDIVITDIRMPVMDGLTMASHIKEENKDVPIIITTGHNDEQFFLRSIDIGVDKYIKKPVNFKEFIEVLGRVARGVLQQKEIDAKNAFIKTILDTNPHLIMITDGEHIDYLNNAFLAFTGVDSVEEYCDTYGDDLDEFMMIKDDSFVRGKSFTEWVGEVINAGGDARFTVHLAPRHLNKSDARAFLVTARDIPGSNQYLLTFTDIDEIEREKERFQEMASHDGLTGIFNRPKFDEELIKEIDRVKRYGAPLSIVMFDVDYFKRVNDTFGHQEGDRVLRLLAELVDTSIRKTDFFARYGGEEFVVIMPGTDLVGATDIAERLRARIEAKDFGKAEPITCSFGVTQYTPEESPDDLVRRVDEALYHAKTHGRNRVDTHAPGAPGVFDT